MNNICSILVPWLPLHRVGEIMVEQESVLAAAGLPASRRESNIVSERHDHARRLLLMEETGVVGTTTVNGWWSQDRCDDFTRNIMRFDFDGYAADDFINDDIDCDEDCDED